MDNRLAVSSKTSVDAPRDFVPFNEEFPVQRLNDEIKERFSKEEELKESCLEQLRMLIRNYNVACKSSDEFLLIFLRTRKFDVQRSFELLQITAAKRAEHYNSLFQLQPSVVKNMLENQVYGILPYRDSMGRRIVFRRSGKWKTDIATFEEALMSIFVFIDYLTYDPMSQNSGSVIILDILENSLYEILVYMRYLHMWISFVFKGVPAKYAEIHILDLTLSLRWAYSILEQFLPEKLKKRVFLHKKESGTLLNHISPDILPSEFGGTMGPINNCHLVGILSEHLAKFQKDLPLFLEQNSTKL